MKYCFIDTETSGTDPEKNALLQLAGAIVINGKVMERFNIQSAPFPTDVIEPIALEINGLTEEVIRGYRGPRLAHLQFVQILAKYCDKYDKTDKFQFVGYNGDFDADAIRAWFVKCGDIYFGSWFWWPILDVAKLAGIRLMEQRHTMPSFKLTAVARFLDLDVDESKAHDAAYDIDLTMRMFYLLIGDLTIGQKLEVLF